MQEEIANNGKSGIENKIICFIGPEGSGKSSIAKRLSEETGLPFVTTGAIFRELAKNDPGELGDECRAMLSANKYLHPQVFLRIMLNRLNKSDVANGFVLDGGLRTLEETTGFQNMLNNAGLKLPMKVVYLQIPYPESYRRLVFGKSARRRDDDTWIGVYKRLSKFYSKLDARLAIIEKEPNWELIPVNANRPRGEVYKEVVRKVVEI